MKIEINAPAVATIGVSGPTQCGKSTVMLSLARLLETEFGATVVLNKNLQAELHMGSGENLAAFERRMISETVWVLGE